MNREVMGVIGAEIVEIIRVKAVVGMGTKEDPVRNEVQYWDKNGKLIHKETYVQESND